VEAQIEVQTETPQATQWTETENHSELEPFHIDAEKNADPIDGMLLLPNEATVRCACGLVYRLESVRWLQEQLGGECVQCRASIGAPLRRS
jgi:hypothetical protein